MTNSNLSSSAIPILPTYRADIDGLRAIAVLSVVSYHAFSNWIPGGFIGVDIFFVISGFLISTIIFENLEQRSFSFLDFYIRRIKRIFPALLLVLAACFLIGWNFLVQIEFKELNKHIVAGAGFFSNIALWYEAGYFDTRSDAKPLLHLWSLGIEEQFYIVWPLLAWAAWKWRASALPLVVVVAVLSFSLGIWKINSDAVAAFYSPQTRFWELSIGSLLAYLVLFDSRFEQPTGTFTNNLCSVLGFALIGIGLALITRESAFPGWWALLPTVGAAMIIAAGPQSSLNRTLLSNPVLVWFGLISYPLYLWHWPLLSFMRVTLGETPPAEMRLGAVLVAIVLSWLTYKLVERPVRFHPAKKPAAIALLCLMFVVGSLGVFSFFKERNEGYSRTFATLNPLFSSGYDGGDLGYSRNGCGIADVQEKALFAKCLSDSRQPPKYALLGDSKADSLHTGLIRASTSAGRWLFIGGMGQHGAPVPIISDNPSYSHLQRLASIAVDRVNANPDIQTVALVTATGALFQLQTNYSIEDLPDSKNYAVALEGLSNVVRRLLQGGKKVVLVVDNPTFEDPVVCIKRTTSFGFINERIAGASSPYCSISIERQLELSRQYLRLLSEVQRLDPDRVKIFDTLPQLCDKASGLCLPTKNGRLLYSYSYHISDYAAGLVGKELNEFLAQW